MITRYLAVPFILVALLVGALAYFSEPAPPRCDAATLNAELLPRLPSTCSR